MKVLVVKAKGSGGFAEPQTATYLSSVENSPAPDNEYVRNLIDNGQVELVRDLGEKSEWEVFMRVLNRTPNYVYSEALVTYEDELKHPKKFDKAEGITRQEPVAEPVAPKINPGAFASDTADKAAVKDKKD